MALAIWLSLFEVEANSAPIFRNGPSKSLKNHEWHATYHECIEIRIRIKQKGFRTREVVVHTSLLDDNEYKKHDIDDGLSAIRNSPEISSQLSLKKTRHFQNAGRSPWQPETCSFVGTNQPP